MVRKADRLSVTGSKQELKVAVEIELGLELDIVKTVGMLVSTVDTFKGGFEMEEHLKCLKAALEFAFVKQILRLFLASRKACPF